MTSSFPCTSTISHGEINIELNRLNTIDFSKSWAAGLAQLLKKLNEEHVPHNNPATVAGYWREHHSATRVCTTNQNHCSRIFSEAHLPPVSTSTRSRKTRASMLMRFRSPQSSTSTRSLALPRAMTSASLPSARPHSACQVRLESRPATARAEGLSFTVTQNIIRQIPFGGSDAYLKVFEPGAELRKTDDAIVVSGDVANVEVFAVEAGRETLRGTAVLRP